MGLKDRVGGEASRPDNGVNLVGDYLGRLLQEIDRDELRGLTATQQRVRLERRLGEIISIEGPVLSPSERAGFIRRVIDEALGLGVLEPLLADESITEIMVNGPHDVFVERRGQVQRHNTVFSSTEQLMQTIDRIVSRVNRRVDESSPMVDARLDTGERVNVIIPPLALNGPTLTIRRFPRPFKLAELVRKETLDSTMAALLGSLVRAKANIIISGGTGTGKTTFLNALSGVIPERERIVTIEDAAELSLQQPHVVRLESRPANVEGRGEITIRDLVRNSLRMRPDRIVVGEVRGGETLDMLQAMSTGHAGSLATVHANSAADALGRLETLASMSELRLPVDVIRDQLNSAVDVIVQLERLPDGSRRVVEIAALVSERRETYTVVPISRFEHEPAAHGQPVTGRFVHESPPDGVARLMHLAGEQLPSGLGVGA
ncbi:CpaF family protein [Luteipulveratus halotolerans]|uniref:Secretion protein n=1 Tax=Luteipulveratus halotolerans TaxID=1631356 RepID=A0A0L6CKV0_9MICO|nr:CpaF family protein [Luteipulveratus halotolerans]KNX38354.1 secretion protein [Luteipulveratus halotolerans]